MKISDYLVYALDWYYPLAFIWGLLIVVSFIGWGRLFGRRLVSDWMEIDFDWGLAASWGMAFFLCLSGLMIALSIFSSAFVVLFMLGGLVLLVGPVRFPWLTYLQGIPVEIKFRRLFIGLCVLSGLSYAGAVGARWYNENDDFPAYFALIKMLFDTGTLYDPFSFRLIGALGGQTALDASVIALCPWKYTEMVDMGIAELILMGLSMEMIRGKSPKAWIARLMIGAFILTFPVPRANTASELTGTVLFVALFRTFYLIAGRSCPGHKASLLLGGVMAAVSTLRCQNIFSCALLGAGFIAWRFYEDRNDRKEIVLLSIGSVVATTLLLASWWEVTYRCSGVFLYPLIRGNQQPEFSTFSRVVSIWDIVCFIVTFFATFNFLMLFAPLGFLEKGRQRRFLFIQGGIVFMFCVALLAQFTFGVPFDLYRYVLPLALAFCLYSMAKVMQEFVVRAEHDVSVISAWQIKAGIMLGTFIMAGQGLGFIGPSDKWCQTRGLPTGLVINVFRAWWGSNANHELWANPTGDTSTAIAKQDYSKAFATIPLGSKVLIALDYPFLLDYKTYVIRNIDEVGAVSPPPGFPYFKGEKPVKKYLLAQDIHYIAHVHFDYSVFLHSRKGIEHNLSGTVPIYRYLSTYELDFCNNVDQIAKTNEILFDSPTIRIIDLDGYK